MQHLLSEDEYNRLKNKHSLKLLSQKRLIGELCQRIANTEEWEKATGNMCIRDGGRYCSGCPVKDECTWDNKRYAK